MKKRFVFEDKPYTFFDYFKLSVPIDELCEHFGYGFDVARCKLPSTALPIDDAEKLRADIERRAPFVELNNEATRREMLIAPLMMEVIDHTRAKLKIEFPLKVSEQLQGIIDYYLQTDRSFLVVEAKNEDLYRGFVQMAAELIALEQWTETQAERVYGAVSTGTVWQFGVLDRTAKTITQDVTIYSVPKDLPDLLKILVGIMNGE